MAVREFDGTDDNIARDVGALSGMQYGTVVTLVKRVVSTDFKYLHSLAESDGDGRLSTWFEEDGLGWGTGQGDNTGAGPDFDVTDWLVIIPRKPTGDVNVRWSVYNSATDTWTHQDSPGACPDAAGPGAGGTVNVHFNGSGHFEGRVAAQAVWSNSLPWSADTSGDSAIEAAGLETAYQNWIDASPDAAWRFNQESTSTAVVDDTGNGADQTSITGTTVVTGDDPPGFNPYLEGEIIDGLVQASSSTMSLPHLVDTNAGGKVLVVTSVDRGGGVNATFSAGDATLEANMSLVHQEDTLSGDTDNRRAVRVFAGPIPDGGASSAIIGVDVTDSGGSAVDDATSAAIINVDPGRFTVADTVAADSSTSEVASLDTGTTSTIPSGDHLLIAAGVSRGESDTDNRWTETTSEPDDPGGGTHQLSVLNSTGANALFGSMGVLYVDDNGAATWSDTFHVTPNNRKLTAVLIVYAPGTATGGLATIAATANNAMPSVGPMVEFATVSATANNATVARAGNPDGVAATVSVTANNATVDAVSDTDDAMGIAATVSVTANDATVNIGPTARRATLSVAGQGATPTSQSQVTANRGTVGVVANDATVTVDSESVTVNAQTATVDVTANAVTPTGEANATATAATIGVTANSPSKSVTGGATVDVTAHNASAAVDAGEIAHATNASITVSAVDATITVSENVTTGAFEADVSVTAFTPTIIITELPEPQYDFFPPTAVEHLAHLQHDPFLKKLTWEKGVSLVREGDTFVETRYVVPDPGGPEDQLTEGVDYFVGGHHYTVPESVALELIAAGYEPELVE